MYKYIAFLLCEQFPMSPIHWLRWHEKYHVSRVSLHRIITLSPIRLSQAFGGTYRSGHPITAFTSSIHTQYYIYIYIYIYIYNIYIFDSNVWPLTVGKCAGWFVKWLHTTYIVPSSTRPQLIHQSVCTCHKQWNGPVYDRLNNDDVEDYYYYYWP